MRVHVCMHVCMYVHMKHAENAGRYPAARLVGVKIWYNKALITAERLGEKYELNYSSVL